MKNEEDLIHQNKLKWCHQNLSLGQANPAMTYNLSYFMTAYIFYDRLDCNCNFKQLVYLQILVKGYPRTSCQIRQYTHKDLVILP